MQQTMEQFMDNVRQRLTQYMTEHRISVNSISEQTNFSPSTLNNICNGRTKSPSLYTVYVACSLLDLSPMYLMDGTGPKSMHTATARLERPDNQITGTINAQKVDDAFNIGGHHTTTNNCQSADQTRLVETLTKQLEVLQAQITNQQQTILQLTDTNSKLTTRLLSYIR